jgi:hypothetical protein
VNLDDDVAAEVERLRRERGLGLSAALNTLAREGIGAGNGDRGQDFTQPTADLGLRLDVTDIAEVLDVLESS